MKLKHLAPWIIALFFIALVATPVMAKSSNFKLGIVVTAMSSETHARTAHAAEEAAKKLGWDVTILDSQANVQKMVANLENLAQAKVNAILICMGKPVETEAALATVAKAGIPMISVMSGTSPYIMFDITVNEYQVGAEAALYLLGQLNYKGNILTQRYESHVGTRIRGKILDVVLSENRAVKVIGSHTMAKTKSWREDVRKGMEAILLQKQGQFQGIWASFDAQAFIIDDLLQAQGYKKGDIVLVSIDGGQETFRRIRDPRSLLTASVFIPFEKMGKKAVELMDKIVNQGVKKEQLVTGPYLFEDALLIDKHNVPPEGQWPQL
ncbi:MAG TPA: sugar ABC transporter substrate-binding protein [Deltaproteobacteria bacterium]|nr:MAG: sugar ABC transporter substrate-binding protein [Deltaproteobacteria bacterium]HDM77746.1 sugar ABC transporter substrate-binding protein [Deltaproteobacteria bacterium]